MSGCILRVVAVHKHSRPGAKLGLEAQAGRSTEGLPFVHLHVEQFGGVEVGYETTERWL